MSIQQLFPYLNFDGTAAQAIALYERALDATVEGLQRFSEIPGDPPAPENADRVMHAVLHIGAGKVMLSDVPADVPLSTGSNQHVCLDFDDPSEMATQFEALGVGGRIDVPLQDTFWGAKFGMLTDAYGIRWMFNCTLQ